MLKPKPWMRWPIRVVALLLAAVVLAVWHGLERDLGGGAISGVLRGVVLLGIIVGAWYWTASS